MAMPWNPKQALTQTGEREYLMQDGSKRVAIIRNVIIYRPAGRLWRSVTADDDPSDRTLIGYFPTLDMAASVTWRSWLQRGKPVEDRHL